jgi:hypothetical protein
VPYLALAPAVTTLGPVATGLGMLVSQSMNNELATRLSARPA